jgi:hypothetical protein
MAKETKEPLSTSNDEPHIRAAGEGMVKRHSPEGDKRIARQKAEKEAATKTGGKKEDK